MDAAIERWTLAYGLHVLDRYDVDEEGVRAAILAAGATGTTGTCIELIEPMDPTDLTNAIARRLAAVGEGVYHLAFHVDNPDNPIHQTTGSGSIPLIESLPSAPRYEKRSIIHPRYANGVLIELLGPSL
ncbi:hypothetical protein M2251_000165 [Rhodococcus erythropolis]|nr:hypothetical protein [Rhodococcus erythropolis]